ncbi:MAG: cell wall-binding repeat-containing protein [Desulfitobacteriaceae bacterium]|nr:cell wall-binding repeat-containing protein [Desulfitobacteriaceae bacterium]MDD4401974.1 cell wall-binding repeat-containing protein [Desulfitobacteriaceae bacterium]
MKSNKIIITVIVCFSFIIGSTDFVDASSSTRFFGQTRYETSRSIAEYYNPGSIKNVVLSTGNGFADALSACVLAHQKEAPILLTDATVEGSQEAISYISQHLDLTGTVYLIGGLGVINEEFETKLISLGFKNIVRFAGGDRYDTSNQLARSLENTISTVVISSGETYPDALGIAGFAANKGWPILLTPSNRLPQEMKDYLSEKNPAKIYITGGTGVISENIRNEIKSLLPLASIERLAGQDRFETNTAIVQAFNPKPSTLYFATGYGFADALTGSVLAARNGDPMIFIDPSLATLPKSAANYFAKLYINRLDPNLVIFGGNGVVPDELITNSKDIITGIVSETSIYSIADINATVTRNNSYTLPATVQARLYNSDLINVPIRWNAASVDTSKAGSGAYTGVVEGYSKAVNLYLKVIQEPVSQYSTRFNSSMTNRTHNVKLAAKTLDGIVLAPGVRFSFNGSVGNRTVEAGYLEAPIISGDAFVPGIGGGVCQVSTTLYNAALLAHLEILERHPHSMPVNYVPAGKDATVSYPTLDLKFRNSLKTYLAIRSLVEGNTLTIALWEA